MERKGLMSEVTTGTFKVPTKEEMEREFSKPWAMPNTMMIMGSAEFIKEFMTAINDYETREKRTT